MPHDPRTGRHTPMTDLEALNAALAPSWDDEFEQWRSVPPPEPEPDQRYGCPHCPPERGPDETYIAGGEIRGACHEHRTSWFLF